MACAVRELREQKIGYHVATLDLALLGNSSFGALIDRCANVVWACLPRFDSEPVFDNLLKDQHPLASGGVFAIEMLEFARAEQSYIENTAIVATRLYDKQANAIEITDFAPRFKQYGRMFRPVTLVRQIRPLSGSPRVRILCRPTVDSARGIPAITHGSNHIRYVTADLILRLTTDASITAILDETPFVLDTELTLILGPDESMQASVRDIGRRFFEETSSYWHEWVRSLGIPFEWQDAVIRAAITLKLNAYDDTGAVIAAMTTSIPEAAHSERNWDYRYCWLRDAHFVVGALNRLGTTQTMERYLGYIINIAANADGHTLQPVYKINGQRDMQERIVDVLPGYRSMGPVRYGNQAHLQVQNDVYGSAILAATHVFFDRRMRRQGDEALFRRLEPLGELAAQSYALPDAGPWELRNTKTVHTFSSVMCWAACDRLAKIAAHIGLRDRMTYWRETADNMKDVIERRAWNDNLDSFVQTFGGSDLDASLLLLHDLGFLSAEDPRFASTVKAVEQQLRNGDFLFRYVTSDDFGTPQNAFTICTFWYIDALAALGQRDEARRLFENLLTCRNEHGLLSEDLDPDSRELWGNFPQTYSMVGIISSATRLSKQWEDVF